MKFIPLAIVSLAGLLGVSQAFAQQAAGTVRPDRPSRALFGSGVSDADQVLAVTGAVGVGYDTSPQQDDLGLTTGQNLLVDGSAYAFVEGGLSYENERERFDFATSISSAARRYLQSSDTQHYSHAASVGGGLNVGQRTRLNANQSVSYQSVRGFVPFLPLTEAEPGLVSAPDLGFAAQRHSYLWFDTSVRLSHQLSQRTALSGGYQLGLSDYSGSATEYRTESANFRLTRSLNRSLALRLGYGFTATTYRDGGDSFRNHNLDTGIDFTRSLSLTRRTQLSFSTGATAIKERSRTQFDIIGGANLGHEMGRTWNATLVYSRNVGYNDAVRGPYFYDGVSTGFGGQFSRRLGFSSSAGLTRGETLVADDAVSDNVFVTYYGRAGLSFALTRHLAIGADYMFYEYDFDRALLLSDGFRPALRRHSVLVSLNVWTPLFERRTPNAAR